MSVEGTTPTLRRPTGEEIFQLTQWFGYHMIGSLMPIWCIVIYVLMFTSTDDETRSAQLTEPIADGQLFLLAAALVSGVFYYSHKGTNWKYRWHSWLTLLGIFLIVISSLVFGMNMAVSEGQESGVLTTIAPRGLIPLSLVIYVAAMLMSLLIELMQIQRETYRPQIVEQQRVDDLAEQLHLIRDQKR